MHFIFGKITKTYKHINRYSQILKILIKYGFDSLLHTLNITHYIEIGVNLFSTEKKYKDLSPYERIRKVFEELGPTFIKFGQIISTRADLIPLDLIYELEKLQDNVAAVPFSKIKQIVEQELDASLEDMFISVDETPLAAASIGQVHQAKLKNGDDVVIKVQRPDIASVIEVDCEIMLHFAKIMEKHLKESRIFKPVELVKEFIKNIDKEIDYTIEAANQIRFKGMFASDTRMYIPEVYSDLISSKVLVMSYVDGKKISEIVEDDRYDKKIIAENGASLIFKQIFDHGFFHLDPHPGNIFILADNRICFLDFGMMGIISQRTKEDFVELIYNIMNKNESATASALLQLTHWEEKPDMDMLYRDISDFMTRYLYIPLKNIEISKVVTKIIEMSRSHQLFFPPNLFMMLKCIISIEHISKQIDPEFFIIDSISPFIKKIKIEKMYPQNIAQNIFNSISEVFRLFQRIPDETEDILKLIKRGKVKIEFEHHGLDPMLRTHMIISNRVVFAIIIASLIIGSSLIIHAKLPPFIYDIPFFGILGFIIALIMAIMLLFSILFTRSSRS